MLAAGASKYGFQPNSDHCYVYADPGGVGLLISGMSVGGVIGAAGAGVVARRFGTATA